MRNYTLKIKSQDFITLCMFREYIEGIGFHVLYHDHYVIVEIPGLMVPHLRKVLKGSSRMKLV